VTIRAPGTPDVQALEAAPPAPSAALATLAMAGVVVGGTPSGDVIVISRQALAILQAGLPVLAFIINGLESLQKTIALGAGRRIRMQFGIYRLA
jgi:hypothetical protein